MKRTCVFAVSYGSNNIEEIKARGRGRRSVKPDAIELARDAGTVRSQHVSNGDEDK